MYELAGVKDNRKSNNFQIKSNQKSYFHSLNNIHIICVRIISPHQVVKRFAQDVVVSIFAWTLKIVHLGSKKPRMSQQPSG
jgi:hypothetical protein